MAAVLLCIVVTLATLVSGQSNNNATAPSTRLFGLGQGGFGQSGFGQGGFGQGGFGQGGFGQGGFGQGGFGQGGFGQGGFGQGGFGQGGLGQGGFGQGGLGQGGFNPAGFGQGGFRPGGFGPNSGELGFGAGGFGGNPGFIPGVQAPPSNCRFWCRTPLGQAYCCETADQIQTPVFTKPGLCPPIRPTCPLRSFGGPSTCSNDGACGGVDKCCFDTCLQVHVCKPPEGFGR